MIITDYNTVNYYLQTLCTDKKQHSLFKECHWDHEIQLMRKLLPNCRHKSKYDIVYIIDYHQPFHRIIDLNITVIPKSSLEEYEKPEASNYKQVNTKSHIIIP